MNVEDELSLLCLYQVDKARIYSCCSSFQLSLTPILQARAHAHAHAHDNPARHSQRATSPARWDGENKNTGRLKSGIIIGRLRCTVSCPPRISSGCYLLHRDSLTMIAFLSWKFVSASITYSFPGLLVQLGRIPRRPSSRQGFFPHGSRRGEQASSALRSVRVVCL